MLVDVVVLLVLYKKYKITLRIRTLFKQFFSKLHTYIHMHFGHKKDNVSATRVHLHVHEMLNEILIT